MEFDIILAGFGGQGVMLIGKMIAYAAMHEGKEVSWLPSYGPEMRGGTANCTVVVSDMPVGSPVVQSPHALVAMNLPSLDRFEDTVRPGGVVLVNTSLINRDVRRKDVLAVKVPTTEVAMELGNVRAANIVALGAFVGATGLVSLEEVEKVVAENFASKPKAVELNLAAVRKGHEIGLKARLSKKGE